MKKMLRSQQQNMIDREVNVIDEMVFWKELKNKCLFKVLSFISIKFN